MVREFIAGSMLWLAAAPAVACDVALVLAVDVSGSVDSKEYALQARGLAEALGDPVVAESLVQTQAVVTMMQWSGSPHQEISVPWVVIGGHDDVESLRAQIISATRAFRNYSTGIGEAVRFAIGLFETAPRNCLRKIIDVSGDGSSNEGTSPATMRERLDAEEISVNGLAIEGSEEGVAQYYRSHVIHGPGAFVEVARGFDDFPRAIRRKLLRELSERLAMR